MIYLAAPFFTSDHKRRIAAVLTIVGVVSRRTGGSLPAVYQPSEFMVLKPDAGPLEREQVYNENINRIVSSEMVVAIMDDRDTGTIFEVGFVAGVNYTMRKMGHQMGIPVIGVYVDAVSKINVMLQNGVSKTCVGLAAFERALEGRELEPIHGLETY